MATLIAPSHHSRVEDAEALRNAFKGWGADDKAIIAILGHRNIHQRQEIRKAYEEIYQEDLIKRLESEISGDFERAVYRWMLEPADRDAVLVNVAIRNGTKDYHVIAEIACVLSAEELLAVKRAYHNRYKRSLEEDVAADTTGHLRQLLVGLVSTFRYEGDEINVKLAQTESTVLHESVKEKKSNYEEVIRILTTRSKTQLVATFNRYRDEHGISISKKLLDQTSDDFHKVLHTAIRCINDHKKYYEKVLRNAIKKFGTDEDGLSRVIITRAEKDLKRFSFFRFQLTHLRNQVVGDAIVGFVLREEAVGSKNCFVVMMMMAHNLTGQLVGSEIHGFHTLEDLDISNTMEEAKSRWLRPNEIHAILCNHKYFKINAKPMNLPESGTIVLFDRKMLRNFRKDGHNWKKKTDGKTVKEAHEHLKVGNEERIHVYYAHGQDNPTFVRRCYWLLDKSLEHIVLVHYRETQELQLQGSPVTPVNSNSSSVSDPAASWIPSEDLDSGVNCSYAVELNDNLTVKSHEQRLHEINTLEWDDLVVSNVNTSTTSNGGNVPCSFQQNQSLLNGSFGNVSSNPSAEIPSFGNLTQPVSGSNSVNLLKNSPISSGGDDILGTLVNEGLQSQDSFGMWMNNISGTPCSIDESALAASISSVHEPYSLLVADNQQSSLPEQVFNLTDVSPVWASSTEKTKVLVTGYFHNNYQHLAKSNLLCVCGDVSVPVEVVQVGVYRCWVSPHSPGLVNLYLSFDGHKPISQVVDFEYRTPILHDPTASMEEKYNWNEFRLQMRLAHLLFATDKSLNVFSSKVSHNALKEARRFSAKTSFISKSWQYIMKSIDDKTTPFSQVKDDLFEIALKNKLKEWLLERIILGGKNTEYDAQGQGVIHLCAMLGYNWAISLFSWSGLSLDFRDKFGWTALHWAAYYGMEKMVATLLSCGARANLVTDPTPQYPGGCTAADLAYMKGCDGLAAYLSEKSLVGQFNEMSLAGNISGSLETSSTDPVNPEMLTEDQLYLKETLEAYRTTAEAAARIQAAFREHSFKLRYKAVEIITPEEEARQIVAAMRIQHAFRNYESRKKMAAAARIQLRFRTWKYRREFLQMRRQAIKIQAAFRGFQARKQYRKIIWSVGVLEKVILRWLLKRKGFRGLQVNPDEDEKQESDTVAEENFFRTGRKQAEERVERSVVRVQAMFRSKKAQEEYRRMKLAHNQVKLELELEEFLNSEVDMLPKT